MTNQTKTTWENITNSILEKVKEHPELEDMANFSGPVLIKITGGKLDFMGIAFDKIDPPDVLPCWVRREQ